MAAGASRLWQLAAGMAEAAHLADPAVSPAGLCWGTAAGTPTPAAGGSRMQCSAPGVPQHGALVPGSGSKCGPGSSGGEGFEAANSSGPFRSPAGGSRAARHTAAAAELLPCELPPELAATACWPPSQEEQDPSSVASSTARSGGSGLQRTLSQADPLRGSTSAQLQATASPPNTQHLVLAPPPATMAAAPGGLTGAGQLQLAGEAGPTGAGNAGQDGGYRPGGSCLEAAHVTWRALREALVLGLEGHGRLALGAVALHCQVVIAQGGCLLQWYL